MGVMAAACAAVTSGGVAEGATPSATPPNHPALVISPEFTAAGIGPRLRHDGVAAGNDLVTRLGCLDLPRAGNPDSTRIA